MAAHFVTSALKWGKEGSAGGAMERTDGAGVWPTVPQRCDAGGSQCVHLSGCSLQQILTLGFPIPVSSTEKTVELE